MSFSFFFFLNLSDIYYYYTEPFWTQFSVGASRPLASPQPFETAALVAAEVYRVLISCIHKQRRAHQNAEACRKPQQGWAECVCVWVCVLVCVRTCVCAASCTCGCFEVCARETECDLCAGMSACVRDTSVCSCIKSKKKQKKKNPQQSQNEDTHRSSKPRPNNRYKFYMNWVSFFPQNRNICRPSSHLYARHGSKQHQRKNRGAQTTTTTT